MTQGLGTILSLPGWASLTPLGSTSPSILNSRGCARHPAVGSVLFSAPLEVCPPSVKEKTVKEGVGTKVGGGELTRPGPAGCFTTPLRLNAFLIFFPRTSLMARELRDDVHGHLLPRKRQGWDLTTRVCISRPDAAVSSLLAPLARFWGHCLLPAHLCQRSAQDCALSTGSQSACIQRAGDLFPEVSQGLGQAQRAL